MRQAGKHQRTPGGLLLPMRATLKGRIRWQVLDERGVPEVPRNPSGFPLAPAEGVEQPNLITDLGLDQIAAYDCFHVTTASGWRRYLAVGTGSTTPANGDTTLDAEVQRAASSGSFSAGSNSYELDDATDVWRASSRVTRLVTMSADRNITEFGFSPVASGAIGIRELLRDGVGNPITVSLLNGKSLRIDHTLVVEIAAPEAGNAASININEFDAGNNLVNTIALDITHGGHWQTIDSVGSVFNVWNPARSVTGIYLKRITADLPYGRQNVHTNNSTVSPGGNGGVSGWTWEAYVPGAHERLQRVTLSAATENGTWHGFLVGGSFDDAWTGWLVHFDSPATYTKVNTDTLRVGLVSSWARA